jgi:anaerobic selenocysteine-containing dehydrogenase
VYVKDERVVQIEGDPDSPVSRGRLCPKGSASLQLTTGPGRQYQVLYRRPGGTGWEPLDLDTAMDMIADRVIVSRRKGWQSEICPACGATPPSPRRASPPSQRTWRGGHEGRRRPPPRRREADGA